MAGVSKKDAVKQFLIRTAKLMKTKFHIQWSLDTAVHFHKGFRRESESCTWPEFRDAITELLIERKENLTWFSEGKKMHFPLFERPFDKDNVNSHTIELRYRFGLTNTVHSTLPDLAPNCCDAYIAVGILPTVADLENNLNALKDIITKIAQNKEETDVQKAMSLIEYCKKIGVTISKY
jgi:hypothetical protein